MSRALANFLLLIAALCWGSGNVVQQTVLNHLGPLTTTGVKSLIAAIVILPYCLKETKAGKPVDAYGQLLAVVTVLSFAAATTLMQIAYGLTTVTNAGFLVNTATVLTPLFAWGFLRQRPSSIIWLAAVATCIGAILMGGGHVADLNAGDMLSLASAVCFAIWMISLGEFVVNYGRSGLLTIAQFALTAMIFIPVGLGHEGTELSQIIAAGPQLAYLGIISTGGAYLLQAIAQRYTSSSEAAVIVSAEAVFGALAAILILGEHLSFERTFGAMLILFSILLVQMPPKKLPKPTSSPSELPALTPGE